LISFDWIFCIITFLCLSITFTLYPGFILLLTSTDNSGYEQKNRAGIKSEGNREAEKGDNTKYPIETYQGLEEATAERIKRFEDETKAMLMRNSRSDLTPSTPEMGRTTSDGVGNGPAT
jgi:hypothetical protein